MYDTVVSGITVTAASNNFYGNFAGHPEFQGGSVDAIISATTNHPDFYARVYLEHPTFVMPDWRDHDCEALTYDLAMADGNEQTATGIGLLLLGAQAQAMIIDWVLANRTLLLPPSVVDAVKILRPSLATLAGFSVGVVATLDGIHWGSGR